MTERERLLQILNVPIYPHENVDPLEAVTDYLLDNGVKIPVLCKYCMHWDGRICKNPFGLLLCDKDAFCSFGERKET